MKNFVVVNSVQRRTYYIEALGTCWAVYSYRGLDLRIQEDVFEKLSDARAFLLAARKAENGGVE